MRKCGSKVHVKVGRFKFLNQMVKIVSPKYQGKDSSLEVKELTVRLLYSWHKSMPYIEKFKEVCLTLAKGKNHRFTEFSLVCSHGDPRL